MDAKYFNSWEFKQILLLTDTNPFEAKIKFEQYLTTYPEDYSAYPYYISCLITLGLFDESKKILDYINNIQHQDNKFKFKLKKDKKLKTRFIFSYIQLLTYQGKYEDVCRFLANYPLEIKKDLSAVIFYCKCKLGKVDPNTRGKHYYLYRQTISYDENDFLFHVEKHTADFNKDLDNPNPVIFNSDFPLNKVVENIKIYIPSDKKLFTGFYEDTYIFKYEHCGKVNNKSTNYFKVVCFHDTNNIITMYPVLDSEQLPYVDLNYLSISNNNDNSKTRRLSQIDKFNQRYKIN